jgi:hypothetical protein
MYSRAEHPEGPVPVQYVTWKLAENCDVPALSVQSKSF